MKVGDPEELTRRLRNCGLQGDSALRPYLTASIALESLPISDLVPLSKYVLADQLEMVGLLQRDLAQSGLDLFNLECGIVWPTEDGRAIAPPVVEYWEGEGLLLVDGIHRVWSARMRDHSELTCAVIRGATMPLVPAPATWAEVKVYGPGEGPQKLSEKRNYRFSDAASVRAALPGRADRVTDANFRYFLYRDLGSLGSSGIRAGR